MVRLRRQRSVIRVESTLAHARASAFYAGGAIEFVTLGNLDGSITIACSSIHIFARNGMAECEECEECEVCRKFLKKRGSQSGRVNLRLKAGVNGAISRPCRRVQAALSRGGSSETGRREKRAFPEPKNMIPNAKILFPNTKIGVSAGYLGGEWPQKREKRPVPSGSDGVFWKRSGRKLFD